MGKTQENGESIHRFEKRVMAGFLEAMEQKPPVLIVAHSGVYLAIQRFLALPLARVKNCHPIYHEPPGEHGSPWVVKNLVG